MDMAGAAQLMRAAYIDRIGPAATIRLGFLPVPHCGSADVLVRTKAIAANHVDLFVRSGAYVTPLPFSIGDSVWSNSLGYAGVMYQDIPDKSASGHL
jgi:hypothetical protein